MAAQRISTLFQTLHASLRAPLPSFISVSKGKLMQNVYGPRHKRWWCGSVQEDLCAKSSKHLCKHMAFFQPCSQCSHSLKIDVQGNIPCPGAVLEWLWTSEKPWASSTILFQYFSFMAKHEIIISMAFIWLFVYISIGSIVQWGKKKKVLMIFAGLHSKVKVCFLWRSVCEDRVK